MFPLARRKPVLVVTAFLWTGTGLLTAGGASAQDRGFGGPPPGRGFPGPDGPGGFGRGPRPATVVSVPASVLASGLKLTAAQKNAIAGIQTQVREQREKLMPRPPGREDGPGPGRPDFDKRRANGDKVRTLDEIASGKITALLTASQKKLLPGLLQEADMMRSVGLPLELSSALSLSASQKTRVAAIARSARQRQEAAQSAGDFRPGGADREQTRRLALAVLTGAQKSLVAIYRQTHPRPEPGGPPGGFRGGPGGDGPPLPL